MQHFLLSSDRQHHIAEPVMNHTSTPVVLRSIAFWYNSRCMVTAEKARHVAGHKVCTALAWHHTVGGCTPGTL